MAAKKNTTPNAKSNNNFHAGDKVSFNYRSATGVKGTVVGVAKQGRTNATTVYNIQPEKQFIHPGEKLPVHRTGAHLRHR